MNFWEDLYSRDQPVIGMSPMDGVTDSPFRYMVAKYGRPDVIFTEFVSVDGLHFAEGVKRERMLKEFIKARDLLSSSRIAVDPYSRNKIERENGFTDLPAQAGLRINETYPYEVAQVFGNKPEFFVEAAKLIESLGFDGVDINMGCPAKNVSENGCGAALIKMPKLAQEIILATKAATQLPVSVKTRIGVSSSSEMDEWMAAVCEVHPANISLHGRTLKQLYQGSADWETIGRAAEIVHKAGLRLLGNGDVKSIQEANEKVTKYGVDGVLVGRAAEGNPQIFQGIDEPDYKQRLSWAVEHAYVYERVFKPEITQDDDIRWFLPLRKHLAWYAHGFPGAVELRMSLMKTKNADEVRDIVEKSLSN